MKLFIVEFGHMSSGQEKSVIFADNIEEVKEIIKCSEYYDDIKILFVETEPKSDRFHNYRVKECRIEEVPIEKGIVYTGYYCC